MCCCIGSPIVGIIDIANSSRCGETNSLRVYNCLSIDFLCWRSRDADAHLWMRAHYTIWPIVEEHQDTFISFSQFSFVRAGSRVIETGTYQLHGRSVLARWCQSQKERQSQSESCVQRTSDSSLHGASDRRDADVDSRVPSDERAAELFLLAAQLAREAIAQAGALHAPGSNCHSSRCFLFTP